MKICSSLQLKDFPFFDKMEVPVFSNNLIQKKSPFSISLYIHFPYCEYKCHYCDFNSYVLPFTQSLEENYIQALQQEWVFFVQQLKDFKIQTVFFGGGTPSLFSPASYEKIFGFLRPYLNAEAEITLEANPKSLNEEKILAYQSLGINRFSVGVQSFNENYLKPLGRLHSSEEAIETINLLKKLKVKNFSFDLMYGFPQQSTEEILEDLERALQFQPNHLSFYQLTLEIGTLFHREYEQGKWQLPAQEILAEMYEKGEELLERAGYQHYELSNYAKNYAQKDFQSQHNLAYWNYENYLALGAGGVSYLRKDCFQNDFFLKSAPPSAWAYRWTNPKTPKDYQAKAKNILNTLEIETISAELALKEHWMMSLRLEKGICLKDLKQKYASSLLEKSFKSLDRLINKGLLEQEGEMVFIPKKYRLLTNEVILEFF